MCHCLVLSVTAVAWILKADPTARPSVKEVLESVRKRLGELGVEMAGPGQ